MRVSPDCFAPPPEANEDEDDDAAAVAAEVVVVVMMVVVMVATVATVMAMAKAGWWYPRGIRETRGPALDPRALPIWIRIGVPAGVPRTSTRRRWSASRRLGARAR